MIIYTEMNPLDATRKRSSVVKGVQNLSKVASLTLAAAVAPSLIFSLNFVFLHIHRPQLSDIVLIPQPKPTS